MAALDAVLGLDHEVIYDLVDDAPNAQAPPTDVDQLVQLGLKQRPDLQALDLEPASRGQVQPRATGSDVAKHQLLQEPLEAFRYARLSTT